MLSPQPFLYIKRAGQFIFAHYSLPIFFCFCVFISLAPSFDLIIWASRYDEKRLVQLVLLLLTVCWLLISKQAAKEFSRMIKSLPNLSRWGLALVFLTGLFSSFHAPSTEHATAELSLFIYSVFFSLSVATLTQHYSGIIVGALLTAVAISAFCYEATFFTSYVGIFIQGNPLVLPEPFSGFSSIRFFNQFQIWTLPLIALPLLLYPRLFASIRWLLILLSVGWWVLLFASQSRGAQLAIVLAGISTLLVFRKAAWHIIKTMLLTAIGGGLTHLLLFVYIPGLEAKTRLAQLAEDPARLQLWSKAVDMIADNPWLGVGPMHYAYYPNVIAAHPHNALLQIAAEWGLPVAIVLVVLTCWGLAAWCTRFFKNREMLEENGQRHLWIALFYSLVAGLAYSMVSGVIVTPLSQTMFSVVVGLMLGLYYPLAPTSTVSASQTTVLRLITGMAMAGLLWTVIPDILVRMETGIPDSQGNIVTFGPRFWQEGGIPH